MFVIKCDPNLAFCDKIITAEQDFICVRKGFDTFAFNKLDFQYFNIKHLKDFDSNNKNHHLHSTLHWRQACVRDLPRGQLPQHHCVTPHVRWTLIYFLRGCPQRYKQQKELPTFNGPDKENMLKLNKKKQSIKKYEICLKVNIRL